MTEIHFCHVTERQGLFILPAGRMHWYDDMGRPHTHYAEWKTALRRRCAGDIFRFTWQSGTGRISEKMAESVLPLEGLGGGRLEGAKRNFLEWSECSLSWLGARGWWGPQGRTLSKASTYTLNVCTFSCTTFTAKEQLWTSTEPLFLRCVLQNLGHNLLMSTEYLGMHQKLDEPHAVHR